MVTAAYVRSLGARGGRVALIVLLLAVGIAGTVVGDRGLDFSLVWLPLELLILTKARTNPRWLWCLPLLSVVWVNTHGSILLGLLVLALRPRLVPDPVAPGASHRWRRAQSPHPVPLALALLGSLLASGITPYGSRAARRRHQRLAQRPDRPVHRRVELARLPLGRRCSSSSWCLWPFWWRAVWKRRIPVLECSLAALLFVDALRTERIVVYFMLVAAGLAACLPASRPWGTTARRWAGAGLIGLGIVIVATPSVPAGTVSSGEPVQAFNYLSRSTAGSSRSTRWGDYSITRHRATFVDGRTDLFEGKVLTQFFAVMNVTTEPRSDPVRLPRRLRRVGTAHAVVAIPRHAIRTGTWLTVPRWLSSSRGVERSTERHWLRRRGGRLPRRSRRRPRRSRSGPARAEELGLLASQLEQQRSARAKDAGRRDGARRRTSVPSGPPS